jgi:hypothetical protein
MRARRYDPDYRNRTESEDAIRCKTPAPEVRTFLTGDVEETSDKRKYGKINSAWFVARLIGWLVG